MTRRAALLGGAGLAAVAVGGAVAGGAAARPLRAARVAFGACDVAAPAVAPSGAVRTESTVAGVGCVLAVPPAGAQHLLVCLHGRGGAAAYGIDVVRLPDHLAGAGVAVLGVQGPPDCYWHDRAGAAIERAVVHDLVPAVRTANGLTGKVALLGWSMGGYGAILLGQRHPGTFSAVAAASPAVFTSYADARRSNPRAFDDAADFAAHDVIAGAAGTGPSVHLTWGDEDPFVPGIDRYVAAAVRAGRALSTRPSAGCHTDPFWKAAAPAQAVFLRSALG